ncbi:MAG: siderophore-interacting protein [Propionicimonas sp.]|nr:siderophore-interacting protein [Propionicimonas sp.]
MSKTESGPRIEQIPLGRRLLRVVRSETVTPRMRRIVLAGEDLAEGFPWQPMACADHVKVFFPRPGGDDLTGGEVVMPRVHDDAWHQDATGPAPLYRDYTVRAWDPGRRELTLDFVLHPHGIGGAWAGVAQAGDPVGVLGPRGHVHYPSGHAWYLVAGDETALPAVARFIEELPGTARGVALVEVADAAEQQRLEGAAGIAVQWVRRDRGEDLATAVRAVAVPGHDDWFAFAAGEATLVKPVRRYLRRELGLPPDRVDVDGYWKRGTVNLDHHQVEDEQA